MHAPGWRWAIIWLSLVLFISGVGFAQTPLRGNTPYGDNGLFNIIGALTLPARGFSAAVAFDNFDRDPLDIDQTDYRVGLAYGLTDWLQLTASFDVFRVLDIDPKMGPGVFNTLFLDRNYGASGVGDIWAGMKVKLYGDSDEPVTLGILGRLKIPVADENEGLGTGKADLDLRGLIDLNLNDTVGLFGNAGVLLAADSKANKVGNQFTYGIGFVVPYHFRVQLVGELSGATVEEGGQIDDFLDLTVGLRFFVTRDVNISLAYRRNLQGDDDNNEHPDGAVFTLGYWPNPEEVLVADTETLPPPPSPPGPPLELPPPPPPPAFQVEEIYFAFDRYDLRESELPKLDKMVQYLKEHPDEGVVIEGHTCYIGTEEYNMALGLHRAEAVKQYLIDHGIDPARIEVISYGESKPKYDNSREITRRFNRRVWFVLKQEPDNSSS